MTPPPQSSPCSSMKWGIDCSMDKLKNHLLFFLPLLCVHWSTLAIAEVFQTSKKIHLYPSNYHDAEKNEIVRVYYLIQKHLFGKMNFMMVVLADKSLKDRVCRFIVLCSAYRLSRWESGDTKFFWNGPMAFLACLANCSPTIAAKQEEQRLFPLSPPKAGLKHNSFHISMPRCANSVGSHTCKGALLYDEQISEPQQPLGFPIPC